MCIYCGHVYESSISVSISYIIYQDDVFSIRVMLLTLGGLTGSALDHRSLPPEFSVGISEGCFIFDLASLPLEVARPI